MPAMQMNTRRTLRGLLHVVQIDVSTDVPRISILRAEQVIIAPPGTIDKLNSHVAARMDEAVIDDLRRVRRRRLNIVAKPSLGVGIEVWKVLGRYPQRIDCAEQMDRTMIQRSHERDGWETVVAVPSRQGSKGAGPE